MYLSTIRHNPTWSCNWLFCGHDSVRSDIFSYYILYFFFFQAEDGIRDDLVTGVQTCALPISLLDAPFPRSAHGGQPPRQQVSRLSRSNSKLRSKQGIVAIAASDLNVGSDRKSVV